MWELAPADRVVAEVRQALREAADPTKAPAMQAYMKSTMPFLGVSSRPLQQACRSVFDVRRLPGEEQWRRAVLMLWDEAKHREDRYAAIALSSHRFYREHQRVATLDLYRHLVVSGAWWDYVDNVAANRVGPILRARPERVAPLMRAWAEDRDLWVRRTAVLCQLGSKDATDVELLRHVLERNVEGSRHGREFFIRKAVGWALRQHARVDPTWVLAFVEEHATQLSGLSRREALKHLR